MTSKYDLADGQVGQQRAKCSMSPDKRKKITWVPGIYDATMSMKIGSDGKPVLTVEDLDFVGKAVVHMEAAK